MTHLNFIAAATALTMVTRAWGCIIGEPGWLDKCDKEFSVEHPVNIPCADQSKVLVGDKCVTMTDLDDAPRIQIPSRSLERAPDAIYTVNGPGICLAGNTVWAAKNGKCEPIEDKIYPELTPIGPIGQCTVDGMHWFSALENHACWQPCAPGYALLAYPGTWTLVCARDVQAPQMTHFFLGPNAIDLLIAQAFDEAYSRSPATIDLLAEPPVTPNEFRRRSTTTLLSPRKSGTIGDNKERPRHDNEI